MTDLRKVRYKYDVSSRNRYEKKKLEVKPPKRGFFARLKKWFCWFGKKR